MSELFTTVAFGSNLYFFAGSVSLDDLSDFEPLQDRLACLQDTETELVYVTPWWFITDEPDKDMSEDSLDYINENFSSLLADEGVQAQSEIKYKINGVLPIPYEDYYKLEGLEREEYLNLRQKCKEIEDQWTAELKEQGLSDDDIEDEIWARWQDVDAIDDTDIDDSEVTED